MAIVTNCWVQGQLEDYWLLVILHNCFVCHLYSVAFPSIRNLWFCGIFWCRWCNDVESSSLMCFANHSCLSILRFANSQMPPGTHLFASSKKRNHQPFRYYLVGTTGHGFVSKLLYLLCQTLHPQGMNAVYLKCYWLSSRYCRSIMGWSPFEYV